MNLNIFDGNNQGLFSNNNNGSNFSFGNNNSNNKEEFLVIIIQIKEWIKIRTIIIYIWK